MNTSDASNSSLDRFIKLAIEQEGFEYHKGYIDEVNTRLVAEHLHVDDNQHDDFTLVAPNDPTLLLTLTIQSLLEILKYDIEEGGLHTLDNVKPGESVGLIQDRFMYPGIFEGTEEMNGQKFYVVRRADIHMTEKIPQGRGREWRVQPYSSADVIASKRRGQVYGKELEKILELPTGGLKAFQKSKILVVPEDKRAFIEQIRCTKIGGDFIETIFPVAEYTSPSDWRYIGQYGANNIKQQPALGIVSNGDVAVDIALGDPDVRLLLLSGSSKLRRNFGSIERLNYDDTPRKIILVLEPTEEEEMKTLSALGIESWVWKRPDFREGLHEPEDSSPFRKHDVIYNKLAFSEELTFEVELPESIERALSSAYRSLFTLAKNVNPLPESAILIRQGIGLVNSILQLPCSISAYDDFIKTELLEGRFIGERVHLFKDKFSSAQGYLIPSTHKAVADELISELETIVDYFKFNSPKADKIAQLISDEADDKSTIGVFTANSEAAVFLSKTNVSVSLSANVERLDSLPCDVAIVSGWSSRRNVARAFLAPTDKLIWVLYKREANNVRSVYKTHPASPLSRFDDSLRERLGYKTDLETHVEESKEAAETEVPVVDDMLKELAERFGHSESILTANNEKEYHGAESVDAWKVTLSDESCVYIDGEHKMDRIDVIQNKLDRCLITDLKEGDQLVFAESDRDMFEELLDGLRESDEYKRLYAQATIWRTALLDYMERTETTENDLVAMFKLLQYPKDINVIRSWIRGNVIGPTGDNYAALRIFERITHDERLKDKSAEIIRAIKAVHAMHIQTGYLLVRSIINSSVVDTDGMSEATREKLKKYSASTRLRTVIGISDYTIPMNIKRIGKLETAEI